MATSTSAAPSSTSATASPIMTSITGNVPPGGGGSQTFKTSSSSSNLSDYCRIYKPSNGGLVISQKGGNFNRTGSFHTGKPGFSGKPEIGNPVSFMRSFSFRKRNDDEHHSSMPCLNANFSKKQNQQESNQHQIYKPLAANTTPSSSTLVINSLAYQILPGTGNKSDDLGSAGYSSPSSSTTSSPQVQSKELFICFLICKMYLNDYGNMGAAVSVLPALIA